MFKFNNKEVRTLSLRHSDVFIANFEHISHLFLLFLLFTLNKDMLDGKKEIHITISGKHTKREVRINVWQNKVCLSLGK